MVCGPPHPSHAQAVASDLVVHVPYWSCRLFPMRSRWQTTLYHSWVVTQFEFSGCTHPPHITLLSPLTSRLHRVQPYTGEAAPFSRSSGLQISALRGVLRGVFGYTVYTH